MKARLLRSLIAEKVSAEPDPGPNWLAGRCGHCDAPVWLSTGWAEILAGDPEAGAACLDCACTLAGSPEH